jgi:serine/threonine-protein kinase
MNRWVERLPLNGSEKTLLRKALNILEIFTLVTLLAGSAAMFITRQHQPMIVPKVVGMDQTQAEKALASKDLKLKVMRAQFDEHVPLGLISEQNPRANSYIKHGQVVEVVLSKGNPKVKVPAVTHQSFQEAQIMLAANRLRVGRESVMVSAESKDTVLGQVPAPDEMVDSFSEVDLLVSQGPNTPGFVMPNLRNQPLEQAFKALRPAGITIEKIKSEVHDDLDSETVLSQTPDPGTRIQPKDSVSFVISTKSNNDIKTRYAKVVFDMPEGNPKRLQVDVFDGSGTRTIYNKMESPRDHVELDVTVTGKASAQIYLNQEFVKEIPIE